MLTEKELRRLRKKQLINMVTELNTENEALKDEISKLKSQLTDRSIAIDSSGSIAEASLKLNDVFAAAQKAADQYLENIRSMNERQKALCEQRDAESKAESERIIKAATEKSENMVNSARSQSQSYWTVLQNKLESFYDAHRGLKQLLEIPSIMVGEVEDKKKDVNSMLAEKAAESTNRLFDSLDTPEVHKLSDQDVKVIGETPAETASDSVEIPDTASTVENAG